MEIYFEEGAKKTDRRVVKTKKAIRNAFADLLCEKDFNEITIKNIADRADVNRKTVYNYYNGIHEILDETENEVVDSFEKILKGIDFKKALENPVLIFRSLTEVVGNNIDFYGKLLKMESNTQLSKKIIKSLVKMATEEIGKSKLFEADKLDMIINYLVAGMVSVYQLWYNSGKKQTLNELSQDVAKLVLAGVSPFINTKKTI